MADLIIVDGGLGQIKVAKEVIDSLNLSVTYMWFIQG